MFSKLGRLMLYYSVATLSLSISGSMFAYVQQSRGHRFTYKNPLACYYA